MLPRESHNTITQAAIAFWSGWVDCRDNLEDALKFVRFPFFGPQKILKFGQSLFLQVLHIVLVPEGIHDGIGLQFWNMGRFRLARHFQFWWLVAKHIAVSYQSAYHEWIIIWEIDDSGLWLLLVTLALKRSSFVRRCNLERPFARIFEETRTKPQEKTVSLHWFASANDREISILAIVIKSVLVLRNRHKYQSTAL